jgi:hypothetical protein
MQRIDNRVYFSGKLVENGLRLNTNKYGVNYICGNLLLRATDGTEQRINVYSEEIKSTGTGDKKQYTGDENPSYRSLKSIMGLVDMKHDPNSCVVISSNCGTIKLNDYVNSSNQLASVLQIGANFIDYRNSEVNQDMKFEFKVNGVIQKLAKEFDKQNNPTGNLLIDMLVINTKGGWKDNDATLTSAFPMELLVPKNLAVDFDKAGYYEGCFATFNGELVNVKTETQKVESMAFGDDKVTTFTEYKRCNEVKSGSSPRTLDAVGITQAQVDALINERELSLKKLMDEGYKGSKPKTNSAPQTTQPSAFGDNNTGFCPEKNPFMGN